MLNSTGISACLSDRVKKMEDNGSCKATHYMGDKDKLLINDDIMCKAILYVKETKADGKKTNKLPPSLQRAAKDLTPAFQGSLLVN